MIAQTLAEALTLNEIVFLKKQVWWSGCNETPFLCRGGIYQNNSYLLVITDSRSVWVTKADDQQINEEKQKFNQSIKIKFEDILKTLDTPLRHGRTNTIFSRLQFRKNKEDDLIFLMEFDVGIYPFKWEFFLTKMEENEIFSLLVDDLINPMAKSIISLEERGNAYKLKCIQLENELIKRLGDKERANYMSIVDHDNDLSLQKFIKPTNPIQDKLVNFDFGPAAKYFLSKHNAKNIIQVDDYQRKDEQNKKQYNNNGEYENRMKVVNNYFDTLDEQPLGSFRPDSKKRISDKNPFDEEEIPSNKKYIQQKLGIKVNYEEVDKIQDQNINVQNINIENNKKKKKKLDFL